VQRKAAGRWSRGDVVRVTLTIDAQADMTWVVVNDPIPAGGTILGSGLGRTPGSSCVGRNGKGWRGPPSRSDRSTPSAPITSFVPKGKWTVEYTVQLNNGGTFLLPSTRVEAIYSPEMFGRSPTGVRRGPLRTG